MAPEIGNHRYNIQSLHTAKLSTDTLAGHDSEGAHSRGHWAAVQNHWEDLEAEQAQATEH